MSGGRFALGLGRGFDALFDVMGPPRITNDSCGTRSAYTVGSGRGSGSTTPARPAATPTLMDEDIEEEIPILMVALGPKALTLAGEIADAVVLHTYMTDEAVASSVAAARAGAEAAGRDPAALRIWGRRRSWRTRSRTTSS